MLSPTRFSEFMKERASEIAEEHELPRTLGAKGILTPDARNWVVGREYDVYEIGTGEKKYAKILAIAGAVCKVQLASDSGKFDGKKLTYNIQGVR